jgi:toxin ParE1/3/4
LTSAIDEPTVLLTVVAERFAGDSGEYREGQPGAALRHVERLEEPCWTLARNPGIGTARDDLLPGVRAFSVGNYVIFFRPASDGIEVVRVVHGARDYRLLFE